MADKHLLQREDYSSLYASLSPLQRRWYDAYVSNGGNATQAARDAGYNAKSGCAFRVIGYENLHSRKVQALLKMRDPKAQALLGVGDPLEPEQVREEAPWPTVPSRSSRQRISAMPKLIDPIEPLLAGRALSALGLRPVPALCDPVRAMRIAATASIEDGNAFLGMVLQRESAVDLYACESEDEARLLLAGVLACFLTELRRLRRQGHAEPREAVAVPQAA